MGSIHFDETAAINVKFGTFDFLSFNNIQVIVISKSVDSG
jgi:hypothetical protein